MGRAMYLSLPTACVAVGRERYIARPIAPMLHVVYLAARSTKSTTSPTVAKLGAAIITTTCRILTWSALLYIHIHVQMSLKIECACKYSAMRHSLTHAQRRRILLLRICLEKGFPPYHVIHS